ncbi:MAG: methionine--tRNA ligase, partial [Pseudomonadota bacterium]
WALKKTDPERMATVLYVLAETIRHIAILVQPVVPDSAAKMLDQLALGPGERSFAALGPQGALKPGTPLPAPQGVFPRYVEPEAAS